MTDYQKPKKNLRLKSRIVALYGTQDDFAIAAGYRSPMVSKIISGRWPVCAATMAKFANRLDCKVGEIFEVE